MSLFVIGTDHNKSSLPVREAICKKRRQIIDFWDKWLPNKSAVLTTCSRIEVWGVARDYLQARFLANVFNEHFVNGSFDVYFLYGDRSVFRHILRLACGLESQLKTEQQIYQQLRAFSKCSEIPSCLSDLCRHALDIADYIRKESGLDQANNNIATIVFDDVQRQELLTKNSYVGIIGTGKVAELAARKFAGCARVDFVARKNRSRAKILAKITKGDVLDNHYLEQVFESADIVISATSSPHYVVTEALLRAVIKKREKPLHIYDVSMPRDVEPAAGNIDKVVLKNLDDLYEIMQINNSKYQDEISKASYLVEGDVKNKWQKVL